MGTLQQLHEWNINPELIAIIITIAILTRTFIYVIRIIVNSHNQTHAKFTRAIDKMIHAINKK